MALSSQTEKFKLATTYFQKFIHQKMTHEVFHFQTAFARSISQEINEQLMIELAIHEAKSDDRYN